MGLTILDLVRSHDDPAGTDQIRDATWVVGERVVRRTHGLVGPTDRSVLVRKQSVGEALIIVERPVLLRRVEGHPEDDRPESLELRASITEAPALKRSARGRGRRVPPHRHPRASQVDEPDGPTSWSGRAKRGASVSSAIMGIPPSCGRHTPANSVCHARNRCSTPHGGKGQHGDYEVVPTDRGSVGGDGGPPRASCGPCYCSSHACGWHDAGGSRGNCSNGRSGPAAAPGYRRGSTLATA